MSDAVTRRAFVGQAALAGMAATLGLTSSHADALEPTGAALMNGTAARHRNFDTGWKFSRGDFPSASLPAFDDRGWQDVDLPHDWSIAGPYDEHAPCGGSGGYLPTGIGWYRKAFTLSHRAERTRIAVQFDGIYQRSEVWINGRRLGMRPYGYISFAYDLTPHLLPGGSNVLAVRVDNSLQPNSRWYSGSGINRHAWLVTTGPVHIALWGICVRTASLSSRGAQLQISTRVINGGARAAACVLAASVLDAGGRRIEAGTVQAQIPAGADHSFVQQCTVAQPALWSPSSPALYSLRSLLEAEGHPRDELATSFGIREALFDADRGFVLNGERLKLNGVCLHNDCGAVGTAVPERMWQRRLELLKEMGCNAIRTSHNPPAPELLDLCDALGFLVMAEAFDEWRAPKLQTPDYGYHRYFDEWSVRDLSDMIERDRNHPSIVIWSAGNEVPDQTGERGPQTLQALLDVFHNLDPTRPVTVACDDIAAQPKATLPLFLEKLDVVGYNYVDRWGERREQFYAPDHHRFPQRRLIGTESEAMGGVRGMYRPQDDPPVFGERTANRRIAVEQLQKFVQTYDYVSGDFMWTGIDYLGESRWPGKLAASGVLDTCGFRKDGFYFYQSQWTRMPVLHLFPHWNWPGLEGQIVTIMCYTNCEDVELLLDGRSLGLKGYAFPRPGMVSRYGTYPPRAKALQTTADLHLAWDVPYAPGVLRAIGWREGAIAASCEVRTTGPAAGIRLTADRDRIDTGRSDLAHVTVELIDAAGLTVPTADDRVYFELSGNGSIIGVDNGRPDSHEPYRASERHAFNGLALVLIQSTGRPGRMQLTASAPGLAAARIAIEAT
ncbi:MAG TPA: glycoside hydrolase family 2 TIM barrel-domain containing protein [Steroidobacteraceae bacterium]